MSKIPFMSVKKITPIASALLLATLMTSPVISEAASRGGAGASKNTYRHNPLVRGTSKATNQQVGTTLKYPDLKPQIIGPNGPTGVSVFITNHGQADAGKFGIHFNCFYWVNSAKKTCFLPEIPLSGLKINTTTTRKIPKTKFKPYFAKGAKYRITVNVDTAGQVKESNESNNKATIQFIAP